MALETKASATWGESAWTGSEELARRYRAVRQFTMRLCEPLEVEDYVAQSMTDASPTKWHIAHTTWFFETFVLRRFDDSYREFHPEYNYLFNSYYNVVGKRLARPIRGLMTRPPVSEIVRYRTHVDEAVESLLARAIGPEYDRVRCLVEIGLHHEQQHQELLLTDIKHLFSLNALLPAYQGAPVDPPDTGPGPMRQVPIEAGVYRVGHDGDDFAWDNESPRHRVFLEGVEIGDRLVTNREYLRFIDDGGYRRPELWLDEGWAKVQASGWTAPLYWHRDGDELQVFTLQGLRALELDEPVSHVSFYEAHAFAWWSGKRLPTEDEWETAVGTRPIEGNLAERGRFHPAVAPDEPAGSLRQAFGDVWEWTCSAYRPYPGYRAASGAMGEYNGKFMCNQFVLRGGSCCTPQSHLRSTYRNFFHAAARWQFTGIRLTTDVG